MTDEITEDALREWLDIKIAEAKKAVMAREHMQKTWSSGTSASWKAVGCKLSRDERLACAAGHGRILIKCQRELNMFLSLRAMFRGR